MLTTTSPSQRAIDRAHRISVWLEAGAPGCSPDSAAAWAVTLVCGRRARRLYAQFYVSSRGRSTSVLVGVRMTEGGTPLMMGPLDVFERSRVDPTDEASSDDRGTRPIACNTDDSAPKRASRKGQR